MALTLLLTIPITWLMSVYIVRPMRTLMGNFRKGAGGDLSFIRWNADGTGSLKVPDYNGGEEACWDRWQENADCR